MTAGQVEWVSGSLQCSMLHIIYYTRTKVQDNNHNETYTGPGGTGLGGNDDCNERVQNATSSAFITNFPSTCLLLL